MKELKHQIAQLNTAELIKIFEYTRDLLGLKTVTAYAKDHGHSYNGVDKAKVCKFPYVSVCGKKYMVDNARSTPNSRR
jgi:hypothetical protein